MIRFAAQEKIVTIVNLIAECVRVMEMVFAIRRQKLV